MFSTHSKSKMNKLVDHLINTGAITSTRVADVMRKVDRGDFCDNVMVYDDCPQSINYNATISAPHMHAYCMVSLVFIIKQEWLKDQIKPGSKVLDVGSGSGYLCAAFYELMEQKGKVVGIEHIEGLAQMSYNNLMKNHSKQLESGDIQIICGDGRLGFDKEAPYDVIHVGAGKRFFEIF